MKGHCLLIWLGKKLWFIIPVNPYKKASRPQAIHKTGYWSANNDFREAKKQNNLLYTQPFLILKSTGFDILLLSVKICYCYSFKSYEVQSWKAIYISWQCQITEKDNTCVNFWCIKFLGKLNHVPTLNKTDNFSILELFYVKNKFLINSCKW